MSSPAQMGDLFPSSESGVFPNLTAGQVLPLQRDQIYMPEERYFEGNNCSVAYLVIVVDPFQMYNDTNRTNNMVFIPVRTDCDSVMPACLNTPRSTFFEFFPR